MGSHLDSFYKHNTLDASTMWQTIRNSDGTSFHTTNALVLSPISTDSETHRKLSNSAIH
ncbi:hypothetical protein DPMN_078232 [Dreissena polymorpha]|uniref:Uncharacterized protein n=1 Tax=Dreissena polymorpha TaxID=45954 RepID=A0A9D4BQB6_DREPO|nr:hypothetical protein DPMN_078232 [Dreissena polymorpha]